MSAARRAARLGAALALLLACGAARPAAAVTADARAIAVLEAARAASGGARWARVHAVRYRATVASAAQSGSAETIEDTRSGRYVDRYVLGEVRGGQGFDGVRAWTQDVAGGAVQAGAAEGAAANANEVYRRSLSYWFRDRHRATLRYAGRRSEDGREFDVVAIEPQGGRPFEMWIDAGDHLIARLVEEAAGARRVTVLGDYRRVRGLAFPFTATTSLGDARQATRVVFSSVEIDPPLVAGSFAAPRAP